MKIKSVKWKNHPILGNLLLDFVKSNPGDGPYPLRQNSCRLKFLKKIKFELRDENVYKVF